MLALHNGGPQLALFDAEGKTRVTLAVSSDGQPGLALADSNGKLRAGLILVDDGPTLLLAAANERAKATLEAPAEGPKLSLSDENGFETAIGITDLLTPTTGEKHRTSAASIVLFGKDKKVLWSAPRQDGN